LGYPLNTELLEQLQYETGGNPFIILETLRTFQEMETRSASSTQSRLPLARSVYSLIQNRINRLSPQARETYEFAAVIGPEFDPELVGSASQQNMTVISRAIEELNQRKLIETIYRTPQDISCRFIHDKIRETLMLETNPIRLRFLHEQIALAIESSLDSEPGSQAAVLANHFESAGKLVEAIKYWLQAGQWARQLLSTAEAQQLFSHAEQLISQANANLTDELIHDLYAEWTEMAYETHDVKAIQEQNHNLLTIGRDRKSPLLIGTALDGLSDACLAKNQFAEGLSFTNKAIKYLDQANNVFEKMDAHIHRGVFLYMLGRFHEAIQPFELALKLGDDANNPGIQRAMANGHYQLALTYTLSGWPEAGLKNAARSLELANNIGHPHIATTAYTASSLARYFMSDYQKARHDNTQALRLPNEFMLIAYLGIYMPSRDSSMSPAGIWVPLMILPNWSQN